MMTREDQFKLIKQKIIVQMTDSAPITFIDYDFGEKKLICVWKRINKSISIIKGEAFYNSQNPYECIFMSDYQDMLWKAYHMLELLYIDYIIGEELQEKNYIMTDEDAIKYIMKRQLET